MAIEVKIKRRLEFGLECFDVYVAGVLHAHHVSHNMAYTDAMAQLNKIRASLRHLIVNN